IFNSMPSVMSSCPLFSKIQFSYCCLDPCQERRWGTVAFLAFSLISIACLPQLYAILLFISGNEASRVCGSSSTQLALFTAKCHQVTQRKLLRCVPVWFLPWLLLLLNLVLLPRQHTWTAPLLCHTDRTQLYHCASFIGVLQKKKDIGIFNFPLLGPMFLTTPGSGFPPKASHRGENNSSLFKSDLLLPSLGMAEFGSFPQAAPSNRPPMEDLSPMNPQPWPAPVPQWLLNGSAAVSDAQLLDEQMLRAGVLASLQDAPEEPEAKVEVPKSSVSSLKSASAKAVVVLAATRQLDGSVSLLIDDRVGEEAVMTSKGKSPLPPRNALGLSDQHMVAN
ncbi:unnamed protein product, partial [Coregonus sp. 'balchen']